MCLEVLHLETRKRHVAVVVETRLGWALVLLPFVEWAWGSGGLGCQWSRRRFEHGLRLWCCCCCCASVFSRFGMVTFGTSLRLHTRSESAAYDVMATLW